LDYSDPLLQEIKQKLKELKFPAETKRISLITLILLGIDIALGLLTPHLQTISFFSGKSEMQTVSDLLFLEGAALFLAGAFWGVKTKDLRSRSGVIILLVALGASFLGSSVLIGELFLRH
jgi:hypothetical protein